MRGVDLAGRWHRARGDGRNMKLYRGGWGACVGRRGVRRLGGCGSQPHEDFGRQLVLRKFGHPDYKHTYIWRCIARYLSLS